MLFFFFFFMCGSHVPERKISMACCNWGLTWPAWQWQVVACMAVAGGGLTRLVSEHGHLRTQQSGMRTKAAPVHVMWGSVPSGGESRDILFVVALCSQPL
jgi:hypothetical protein